MNDARHHGYSSKPLSFEQLKLLALAFFMALGGLYFIGHGWYGLFDVDEAIFTQASVEMLESSDYIAPTYNGEPRYHKPPLIYWMQAASLHVFGTESRFGARLPSALFGFSTVLLLFWFCYTALGRNQQSFRFALTASAVFGVNLSWLVIIRAATADAALNFFILASTLSLLSLMFIKSTIWRQIGTGFLLALGMLTKGPIALFIPGVVTLTCWLLQTNRSATIRATNPFVIGAALIAGILPWFAAMIASNGWDFFVEFWLVHNWGRFTGDLGNSHSSSGLYYIWILLVGFFPWVFYLLVFGLALRPTSFIKKLSSPNLATVLPYLGLLWGVSTLCLFSLSGTKLAHYIVPALPGFALFIAHGMNQLPSYIHTYLYRFVMLPFTLLLAFVFIILNPLLTLLNTALTSEPPAFFFWLQRLMGFDWPLEDKLAIATLSQDIQLSLAPYAIGLILLLGVRHGLKITSKGFRHGIMVTAGSYMMALALIIAGIVPLVDKLTAAPLRTLAAQIKTEVNADNTIKVYHLGLHKPSVRHLSGISFTALDAPSQLPNRLNLGTALILHETHKLNDITFHLPQTKQQQTIWQPPVCHGGFCVLKVTSDPTN